MSSSWGMHKTKERSAKVNNNACALPELFKIGTGRLPLGKNVFKITIKQ